MSGGSGSSMDLITQVHFKLDIRKETWYYTHISIRKVNNE